MAKKLTLILIISISLVSCTIPEPIDNVLRICEVRIAETLKLNTNLNGVFHIYAVSKS